MNKHNLITIIKVVFKSRNRWSSYMWCNEFHVEIVCGTKDKVSICASIRLINYKGVISSNTIISRRTGNI